MTDPRFGSWRGPATPTRWCVAGVVKTSTRSADPPARASTRAPSARTRRSFAVGVTATAAVGRLPSRRRNPATSLRAADVTVGRGRAAAADAVADSAALAAGAVGAAGGAGRSTVAPRAAATSAIASSSGGTTTSSSRSTPSASNAFSHTRRSWSQRHIVSRTRNQYVVPSTRRRSASCAASAHPSSSSSAPSTTSTPSTTSPSSVRAARRSGRSFACGTHAGSSTRTTVSDRGGGASAAATTTCRRVVMPSLDRSLTPPGAPDRSDEPWRHLGEGVVPCRRQRQRLPVRRVALLDRCDDRAERIDKRIDVRRRGVDPRGDRGKRQAVFAPNVFVGT